MSNRNRWKSFGSGVMKVSPLMLGVIPFGIICGASSIEAGISAKEAVLMSVVVFAGASQLAVVQLMHSEASWLVILVTGIVINLRMLMYSVSLAGYLGNESTLRKMGVAYLLTDQAYATSLQEFRENRSGTLHRLMFYLGVAGLMWLSFIVSTAVGAVLGRVIPSAWDLGFSVPLTFLALLMNTVKKPEFRKAAWLGAGCGILLHGLPFNLGMLLGAVAGILGGYALETWKGKRL